MFKVRLTFLGHTYLSETTYPRRSQAEGHIEGITLSYRAGDLGEDGPYTDEEVVEVDEYGRPR